MLVSGGSDFILSFYDRLPINDVYRIGQTGFCIHQTVNMYRDIRLNVDIYLERWFDIPHDFRSHMMQSDAIIAGPAAVLFLQRSTKGVNDLDILVPMTGALTMGRYLLEAGYDFHGKSHDPPDFLEAFATMNTRTRLDRVGKFPRDGTALFMREFKFFLNEVDGEGFYTPRTIRMNVIRTHPVRYLYLSHTST